jgi:hypothetical protein
MNKHFEQLMYEAGLTAQGSWDEMDSYDQEAILKLVELIVRECADIFGREGTGEYQVDGNWIAKTIKQHFGVDK